jgi:hypothetical protein
MNRKTLLAAALGGAALMGLTSVAQAVPAVVATAPHYAPQPYVYVQPAPPAPIYEAAPAPRAGWVWAPGFHEWRDGRYVWTTGRWVQERPGWEWQEARWQQRSDGSWYLVGGQWVQARQYGMDDRRGGRFERGPNGDIDGDGVRNADDRDRDGDGVVNRNDDFPNNPNRS